MCKPHKKRARRPRRSAAGQPYPHGGISGLPYPHGNVAGLPKGRSALAGFRRIVLGHVIPIDQRMG
jgi:hypothetical protein